MYICMYTCTYIYMYAYVTYISFEKVAKLGEQESQKVRSKRARETMSNRQQQTEVKVTCPYPRGTDWAVGSAF